MSDILTIPEIIAVGQSSVSLADNDYSEGAIWGSRLTKLTSSVLIAYTTDALTWGYEANSNDTTLRGTANYLLWLCGIFGQQARSGSGGGSVIPVPPSEENIYPFRITSANFQSDGVSYNDSRIIGASLALFINEYSNQWIYSGSDTFSYTATGIIMNIPGFDANTQTWNIMVQKLNS